MEKRNFLFVNNDNLMYENQLFLITIKLKSSGIFKNL